MSILYLLRKYVDPIQFQQQEAEKRRKLETGQAEEAGDDDGAGEGKGEAEGSAARHRCRVCGYQGREPDFCPHCLAGTMVPATGQGADEVQADGPTAGDRRR